MFDDTQLDLIYKLIADEHERRLGESNGGAYLAETHQLLADILIEQAKRKETN